PLFPHLRLRADDGPERHAGEGVRLVRQRVGILVPPRGAGRQAPVSRGRFRKKTIREVGGRGGGRLVPRRGAGRQAPVSRGRFRKKTIRDVEVKGRRTLVRVDFNVPLERE